MPALVLIVRANAVGAQEMDAESRVAVAFPGTGLQIGTIPGQGQYVPATPSSLLESASESLPARAGTRARRHGNRLPTVHNASIMIGSWRSRSYRPETGRHRHRPLPYAEIRLTARLQHPHTAPGVRLRPVSRRGQLVYHALCRGREPPRSPQAGRRSSQSMWRSGSPSRLPTLWNWRTRRASCTETSSRKTFCFQDGCAASRTSAWRELLPQGPAMR